MINLKQIPNSKDEIFNDFAKVYKQFNIIDFTIYQKYGEYSLKLCNQDFYNLLIEWQKVSVNKIDFHNLIRYFFPNFLIASFVKES